MSRRSDRAAERKAVKQAEKDLGQARAAARKAFDLKDPRFLGEAAIAATRGPAGLALFGASRGLQVARERRAENAQLLDDLVVDAKQHADAVREHTSALVAPPAEPQPGRRTRRRIAPLVIGGLLGGAAIAGAAAYVLRDPASSSSPSASPTPPSTSSPASAPSPGAETVSAADTVSGTGPGAGSAPQPAGAGTGEDLSVDAADPEGPSDQAADVSPGATTPAAGSASPGAAAGSAPQPSEDE